MLQQFNFLTLFTCLIVLQKTCAKGLEASLQAKWHGTPIIHEAAEFLVRSAMSPHSTCAFQHS